MTRIPKVRIICADVMDGLRQLKSESVNCCITSPPYWGLRDYGTAEWEGGDADCDHVQRKARGDEESRALLDGSVRVGASVIQYPDICKKCGAKRVDHQIGMEATPQEYVTRLVDVFREVRRVLRKDGTFWINLGDSYAHNNPSGVQGKTGDRSSRRFTAESAGGLDHGMKPKDLVGIPWRAALALQADGWYLRQDIIWAKPNPMPESVTDRCTKAHEYVFLLTKSLRYQYDAKAISERCDVQWEIGCAKRRERVHASGGALSGGTGKNLSTGNTRNARSVWWITSQSYTEAHFATFPEALPRRCILAGCPEGGTVLDPFAGSGTTGYVARTLKRDAILIELNPDYVRLIKKRVHDPKRYKKFVKRRKSVTQIVKTNARRAKRGTKR